MPGRPRDPALDQQDAARRARAALTFDATPRGRCAQDLAAALDEAYYADQRFLHQHRVLGMHGENYDKRWARVHRIVTTHNDATVKRARERATASGWTEAELLSSGLALPTPE